MNRDEFLDGKQPKVSVQERLRTVCLRWHCRHSLHRVDNRAILAEVRKRTIVGGQEEMIVNIALDMVKGG
jgi:hypothetical protein